MAQKEFVPLLIGLMLLTGVCNTLLTKYQDSQCVRDCDGPNKKNYEQPVIQTLQMFIGEMGSWLFVGAFYIYKRYMPWSSANEQIEYQPVWHDDHSDDDDASSIRSTTPINPVNGPLNLKNDDRAPLKGWKVILLGLPAICDICGTTLMNVGLLFVVPSIYQMTRGALVLFVGIFSLLFLKRNLYAFQWFALVTVVLGVGIVGLAGVIQKHQKNVVLEILLSYEAFTPITTKTVSSEALRTIIGVVLIAGAQVFTAAQFVLEEFILTRFSLEPLKVVGWEGTFGLLVTLLGLAFMYLVVGKTPAGQYGYFDIVEGWRETTQNKNVAVSSLLIMISIGGFNYFGLSVTRNVSATARSIIDTSRTLFIWIISCFLGWESFKWLQVLGFAFLVYGTFLFNKLIKPPPFTICIEEEREPYHSENHLE